MSVVVLFCQYLALESAIPFLQLALKLMEILRIQHTLLGKEI